jgi:hypothetical protein
MQQCTITMPSNNRNREDPLSFFLQKEREGRRRERKEVKKKVFNAFCFSHFLFSSCPWKMA